MVDSGRWAGGSGVTIDAFDRSVKVILLQERGLVGTMERKRYRAFDVLQTPTMYFNFIV